MAQVMRGESELTAEDIKKFAEDAGHIWVNAFALIGQPKPELCEELGRMILDRLRRSDVVMDSLGVRHGNVAWVKLVSS